MYPKMITAVIPVYNSAENLEFLLMRLSKVLAENSDGYEVILVNDGSQDSSWRVICDLADKNDSVKGLNLMRNYGQHNALLAGIRMAKHEIIVTIDDDLQHPPEEIPKLLSKLSEGYDIVYGRPAERRHSSWRNISSKIARLQWMPRVIEPTDLANILPLLYHISSLFQVISSLLPFFKSNSSFVSIISFNLSKLTLTCDAVLLTIRISTLSNSQDTYNG